MKKIVTKLILIGMLSCVNALTNVMNAQSIAGGVDHSLFRCSSGVPEARGDSFYGQMGVSGLTGIIAVAAGYDHSMYLKNDGTVWGAGYNPSGALGNGANISIYSPVQAIGLTGITKIAAGKDYSLFIKNDGTAWGVGKNSIGQIGDGTQVSRNIAVQAVSGLGSITAIAAGGLHSLFVKSDGTAWGVGVDYNGQLGDGNGQFIPNHINPVQVLGLTGIIAVDAGESFSLFLKNDGTVWSTGSNSNGQLGDGTTVDLSLIHI
jgi:alpha-tubulin suppressor-like RCC1 family protein